jgi:hypothetical protein
MDGTICSIFPLGQLLAPAVASLLRLSAAGSSRGNRPRIPALRYLSQIRACINTTPAKIMNLHSLREYKIRVCARVGVWQQLHCFIARLTSGSVRCLS